MIYYCHKISIYSVIFMVFYNATQHLSFYDFYFISPVFFFSFYENRLLPFIYYLFSYLLFLPYMSSLQLQTQYLAVLIVPRFRILYNTHPHLPIITISYYLSPLCNIEYLYFYIVFVLYDYKFLYLAFRILINTVLDLITAFWILC